MKKSLIILVIMVMVFAFTGCQEEIMLTNISALSAAPAQDGIYVSWEASLDADCYYVYRVRQDEEKYSYWGVTDRTEFTDITVLEGHQYSYRIYPAIITDNGYDRGDKYLHTGNVIILSRPVISSLQVSEEGCIIRWDAIDEAVKYSVYRGIPGEAGYEHAADTDVNFYIDPVYDGSTAYNYIVESRSLVNGSMYSSQPSDAVLACRVPEITSVVREDLYTAVLTWESVADSTEYNVYRAIAPDGEYTLLGTTSDTMYRDTQADAPVTTGAAEPEQTEAVPTERESVETLQVEETQSTASSAETPEVVVSDVAEQTESSASYYYKIQVASANQGVLMSSNMSQTVMLDSSAPTSQLFAAKYFDFVGENEIADAESNKIYASEFEQDLMYLQQEGYTTITSKELMDYINNAISLPEKAVMLTIDDARYGVYKYAYPLLQKYNMKAVLSIVGKYADSERKASPELRTYCNWDEISEMAVSGCFELASGGYYLIETSDTSTESRDGVTKLPYETMDQYIGVLGDDVELINGKINEITGGSPSVFVYPNVLRDEDSDDVLTNEFGYHLLFGDNDFRRTRMNHFIDGASPDTQLILINRRSRLTGTSLGQYILGAQRFDRMIDMTNYEEIAP